MPQGSGAFAKAQTQPPFRLNIHRLTSDGALEPISLTRKMEVRAPSLGGIVPVARLASIMTGACACRYIVCPSLNCT